MTYLIGIDVGTQSVRSRPFDLEDAVVASASRPLTTTFPRPAWAKQDPGEWWRAAVEALKEILQVSKVTPKEITALSYDCSACTVVALTADFFTSRLTGRMTASLNNATAKWNYVRPLGGWPAGFLRAAKAERLAERWPTEVLSVGRALGQIRETVAREVGLSPDTIVAQGGIDAYAGEIALGAATGTVRGQEAGGVRGGGDDPEFRQEQSLAVELARYLFIYLVSLGAAIALRQEAHIRVSFFMERLPSASAGRDRSCHPTAAGVQVEADMLVVFCG